MNIFNGFEGLSFLQSESAQFEALSSKMRQLGIGRLRIRQSECEIEIELEKSLAAEPILTSVLHRTMSHPQSSSHEKSSEENIVKSPLVGIYYSRPSPSAEPFVKVGDSVEPGTVVAIVEAMKVMNEVKTTQKGVISQICRLDGDPVEYGTPLFRLADEKGS